MGKLKEIANAPPTEKEIRGLWLKHWNQVWHAEGFQQGRVWYLALFRDLPFIVEDSDLPLDDITAAHRIGFSLRRYEFAELSKYGRGYDRIRVTEVKGNDVVVEQVRENLGKFK